MTSATQVAAFFDLDGTLLRGPSLEGRFFAWLLSHGRISNASLASWLAHFAKDICRNPLRATQRNKHYLGGLPISLVSDWQESLEPNSVAFFPQALARISWHMARRHRVFIVSGTLAPLARVFARRISPDVDVAATELQGAHGHWTGALAGEHLSAAAKRRAIEILIAKHNLRLDLSYAYGNSMNDFAMLDCVAHPHAVNPTISLRRVALKRKWPVFAWESAHPSCSNTVLAIAKEA